MKRFKNKIIFCFLSLLVLTGTNTHAQELPPAGSSVISLTVTPMRSIKMTIISAPGTDYWIETNTGNFTKGTIGNDGLWMSSATSNSSTINIYGEILSFISSGNSTNLKGLSVRNHKTLEDLSCNNNQITSIDLKNIPNLRYLSVIYNKIAALDISDLTELVELYCTNNNIITLDVTNNKKLKHLYCSRNLLTALNTSENADLFYFVCAENLLTALDITKNTKLEYLRCEQNKLIALDLSKNVLLKEVFCHTNEIETLDISKNTELWLLSAMENKLNGLDVSKNLSLTTLHISLNLIKNLDVSKNEILRVLGCAQNSLKQLTIAENNSLDEIYCQDNDLSTENFNEIFCRLTDKAGLYTKKIMTSVKEYDLQLQALLLSNASIARAKGWKVVYSDNSDVLTTGTYECASGVSDLPFNVSAYPNPAHNYIHITTPELFESISVYDVYGKLLEFLPSFYGIVNCGHWESGIYFIKLKSASKSKVIKIAKS